MLSNPYTLTSLPPALQFEYVVSGVGGVSNPFGFSKGVGGMSSNPFVKRLTLDCSLLSSKPPVTVFLNPATSMTGQIRAIDQQARVTTLLG